MPQDILQKVYLTLATIGAKIEKSSGPDGPGQDEVGGTVTGTVRPLSGY